MVPAGVAAPENDGGGEEKALREQRSAEDAGFVDAEEATSKASHMPSGDAKEAKKMTTLPASFVEPSSKDQAQGAKKGGQAVVEGQGVEEEAARRSESEGMENEITNEAHGAKKGKAVDEEAARRNESEGMEGAKKGQAVLEGHKGVEEEAARRSESEGMEGAKKGQAVLEGHKGVEEEAARRSESEGMEGAKKGQAVVEGHKRVDEEPARHNESEVDREKEITVEEEAETGETETGTAKRKEVQWSGLRPSTCPFFPSPSEIAGTSRLRSRSPPTCPFFPSPSEIAAAQIPRQPLPQPPLQPRRSPPTCPFFPSPSEIAAARIPRQPPPQPPLQPPPQPQPPPQQPTPADAAGMAALLTAALFMGMSYSAMWQLGVPKFESLFKALSMQICLMLLMSTTGAMLFHHVNKASPIKFLVPFYSIAVIYLSVQVGTRSISSFFMLFSIGIGCLGLVKMSLSGMIDAMVDWVLDDMVSMVRLRLGCEKEKKKEKKLFYKLRSWLGWQKREKTDNHRV